MENQQALEHPEGSIRFRQRAPASSERGTVGKSPVLHGVGARNRGVRWEKAAWSAACGQEVRVSERREVQLLRRRKEEPGPGCHEKAESLQALFGKVHWRSSHQLEQFPPRLEG